MYLWLIYEQSDESQRIQTYLTFHLTAEGERKFRPCCTCQKQILICFQEPTSVIEKVKIVNFEKLDDKRRC